MHPRTIDALVSLSGFVRPFPVVFAVPPQPGEER
jgi:hypothetical protein